MSKANNDRNIIRVGSTKRDDKQWDRLEDRLQTDPNLGGGGPPELIVPGTYIPVVGLPPGVPYLYVIGNLITNYPVDLTATSPLSPFRQLAADKGDFFGLGIDAVLGISSDDSAIVAVKPPAVPLISGATPPPVGHGQADDGLLSADGTLFRMYYTNNIGDPYNPLYKVSVRQPDSSWTLVDLSSFNVIGHGDASDVSGNLIVGTTTPGSGTVDISNVDSTGTVTTYQTGLTVGGITPWRAIVENGFILVHDKIGVPFYGTDGNMRARPSSVTAPLPFINVGSVFTTTAAQALTAKNISIGSTGIAWISHQSESYFSPINNGVVRADLVSGTVQRFPGVLFDNTLSYEITIQDTLYLDDNTCAVSGSYTIPGITEVPVIAYVAIDAFNNLSVNLLEFPDYSGASSIYSMVKVGNTLVFHLYSSVLDATGGPASILFGVTI